jgi:hypothetical protein
MRHVPNHLSGDKIRSLVSPRSGRSAEDRLNRLLSHGNMGIFLIHPHPGTVFAQCLMKIGRAP